MALSSGGNEMLSMAAPPEEDYSVLSLADRLSHKNWKARVNGYEALIKDFSRSGSETDPVFKPYLNDPDQLKKFVTDSNAVAQEKGVEAVLAFVKYAGEYAAKTREFVIPGLVEKCLGSTRAGTKTKAVELVEEYLEVCNGGEGVVGDLLPGLSAKQPKTVLGTVTALKECIRQFGPKNVPPKAIIKALPKVFGASDKGVRAEAVLLTQELYRYMGDALLPLLSDLQPAQLKSLEVEKLDEEGKGKGTGAQTRYTRQQAREAASNAYVAEAAAAEEEPIDPRSMLDPKEVFGKLPGNLYSSDEGCLGSKKWSDRRDALEGVIALMKDAPVMKDSDSGAQNTLVDTLKTIIAKDSNIVVVIAAATVIELMAKGLGPAFAKHRTAVTMTMLEKLKERKQNVIDALNGALNAAYASTSLADMTEDIVVALKAKNPQVKEGSLRFLLHCLQTTRVAPSKGDLKTFSDTIAPLLNDSFEPVRTAAADCLGTMMKIVGERAMNPVMEALDDIRKAKVKEAYDKAEVKCKGGAAPPPPPPGIAQKGTAKPASKKSEVASPPIADSDDVLMNDELSKPVRKPPARLLAKKPPADPDADKENEVATPSRATARNPPATDSLDGEMLTSPTPKPSAKAPARLMAKKPAGAPVASLPPPKKVPAPTAAPAKAGKGAQPAQATDTFKYKYSSEDAEGLIVELIPTEIATGYADPNWKQRLAAAEQLETWVQESVDTVESELVFRFLAGKKRDWNEKNFQVSAKVYNVLTILAKKSPSFGKASAAIAIGHLTDKLGDIKLKKPAGDALFLFAQRTSLSFVLTQAYEPMSKQKAPKVQADALVWLNQALVEFGVAGLQLRALVDFLKGSLQNSNAGVRSAATATLVTLRLFAGSDIIGFLGDVNPQLLNTISTEFDKVEGQAPPEPSRTQADLANVSVGGSSAAAAADAMDSLYPRVDLDKLASAKLLADAKSDAWKTRKEALEALQGVLNDPSNKRLKGSMGEIGQVLKARVSDTNKAVQALALDIITRIATGMGKPFEKHTRYFVVPVAGVLADQKAPIRAAALLTFTAMASACEGLESFVSGIATALETQNPIQRSNILTWVAEWFKEHEASETLDLSSWAVPVIACLDDKSGDVRKAAQAVLPSLIAHAGYDFVLSKLSTLKAASQQAVRPMIVSAKPSGAVPAPAAAPRSSGPATSARQVSTLARPPSSPDPATVEAPSRPAVSKQLNGISGTTGVRSLRLAPSTSRPQSRAETEDERPSSVASGPGFKSKLGLLRKPTVLNKATVTSAEIEAVSAPPFAGTSLDPKRARLAKDRGRWVFDSGPVSKDALDALQHQMEQHTSKDLLVQLFSHDHNADRDHVLALATVDDCFVSATNGEDKYGLPHEDMTAILIANSDLALKYASVRLLESSSTMVMRCLDVIAHVLSLLDKADYSLVDAEVAAFVPTVISKMGDSREVTRERIRSILHSLEKQYPYSKIFQLLLEHGLKSKVARTRQTTLDELASLLNRYGMRACEPSKAFPAVAALLSDRDANVRQSALSVIGEGYRLVGDAIWNHLGSLSDMTKTMVEERIRRLPPPARTESARPINGVARPPTGLRRPTSPSGSKLGGVPRAASPAPSKIAAPRPQSPVSAGPPAGGISRPSSSALPVPGARPKSMLPSRLAQPRSRPSSSALATTSTKEIREIADEEPIDEAPPPSVPEEDEAPRPPSRPPSRSERGRYTPDAQPVSVIITQILNPDPDKSVKALKKIQDILEVVPEPGKAPDAFKELSEHSEGLIETITLQLGQVFDRPDDKLDNPTYRLAKHLVHTLGNFVDQPLLAQSLTVDTLTSLLEELEYRLIQTDDSTDTREKDISRFINMLLLRIFNSARRIASFRSLFAIMLRLARPLNATTPPDSRDVKILELTLKCMWKMARMIPNDLQHELLDPCELFPCIEALLQSIPPNEWRARAANKVPTGDLALRTVKAIINHVVQHYGEDVYDQLSASFDDPSATIVYPYVYRILNAQQTKAALAVPVATTSSAPHLRPESPTSARSGRSPSPPHEAEPMVPTHSAPPGFAGPVNGRNGSDMPSRHASLETQGRTSYAASRPVSGTTTNSYGSPNVGGGGFGAGGEDDPDGRLLEILDHISSETTGSLHKQGITELYQFLKAHPHKKAKVDRMLDATGPQFRKYIARALASRAEDDEDRDQAVAETLWRLESAPRRPSAPSSPQTHHSSPSRSPSMTSTPRRASSAAKELSPEEERNLTRLHDIFRYQGRSSVLGGTKRVSEGSEGSGSTSTGAGGETEGPARVGNGAARDVLAQLRDLQGR